MREVGIDPVNLSKDNLLGKWLYSRGPYADPHIIDVLELTDAIVRYRVLDIKEQEIIPVRTVNLTESKAINYITGELLSV